MVGLLMERSCGLCANISNNREEKTSMLITKKIKFEVSSRDAATLEFMQATCGGLYNWWVMKLKNEEPWPGTLIPKKTLKQSRQQDPEINYVCNNLVKN